MADILIIDDDVIMREMLVQIMEMEGISVISAQHGKQALQMLKTEQVSLVITDIVMPEVEGLEIILFLKNNLPNVQIIAISGGGRNRPDTYLGVAQNFGARFTFTKPFCRESLLIAVKNCLGQQRFRVV